MDTPMIRFGTLGAAAISTLAIAGCGAPGAGTAGEPGAATDANGSRASGWALRGETAVDLAERWVTEWMIPDKRHRSPNDYAHESAGVPLYTLWPEDAGSNGVPTSLADCSYFVARTFAKAYGWTASGFASWLCDGTCPVGRPLARHFHDSVVAQDHFTPISAVADIQRGDLITMKYYSGSTNTGHMLLAAGPATITCSSCTPQHYSIPVIDSTNSYHGKRDSRYLGGACTTDADCATWPGAECSATGKCSFKGIGRGTMRLYVSGGDVVGYSWSTASNSEKFMNSDMPLKRHIAIGRYDGSAGN